MPIYEFYSPDTHKIYSFYARRIMASEVIPRCPDDPAFRMERLLSRFAVTGRAREDAMPAAGDASLSPQQEAAMARLANEMGHISEDNPDPRALGKMMRRMTEIAGQDLPPQFREMVERLEKGDDPEKLEQEYADVFDSMPPPGEEPSAEAAIKTKRLSRPPARDPQLYEMAEYI